MVCIRCKMIVTDELLKLGFQTLTVELGEAELKENISEAQLDRIKIALQKWNLELTDNKKSMLIEKVKHIIIELIYYEDVQLQVNFSTYLSRKLNYEYTYLSNLFSEMEGTTIEHFIIAHKIEKVKELLAYDELSLTEIAWKLHYSSVAHLSNQFKKVTGLTPSQFKMLEQKLYAKTKKQ